MTQIIFLKNFWRCDGKKSKNKKKVPSPRSHLPQQQDTLTGTLHAGDSPFLVIHGEKIQHGSLNNGRKDEWDE